MLSQALCVGLVAVACYAVSQAVPQPYMDEIFHIPQTQRYFLGNFKAWDPKITTPPGLYYVGYLAAQAVQNASVPVLRSVNAIGLFLGAQAVSSILDRSDLFYLLMTFPLLAFYAPLYYTDIWASMMALIGISFTLRGRHFASSLTLLFSLLFRQTNVIWAMFAGALAVAHVRAPKLPRQRDDLLAQLWECVNSLQQPSRYVPYLFVGAAFAGFVTVNGGITLGDADNHSVSFNLPQILYFALFLALFSVPLMLTSPWPRQYLRRLASLPGMLFCVAEGSLLGLVIEQFTVVHPFVLADNRHYIFYLWRRILHPPHHHRYQYAIVPVYQAALAWVRYTLAARIEHIVFWASVVLVLVPSPLLEPRYYAMPYLVWRIVLVPRRVMLYEIIWYVTIDIVTWTVFCRSSSHFMW